MEKRVIATEVQEEDLKIEKNLRPQTLDDYIGQQKAKENLKIYIEAAKARGESLDHVLFYAGTWKDDARRDHRKRDGNAHEDHFRACDRKAGGDGGNPK